MTATTEDIRRKGVLEEVELQLVSKEPQISPDDAQIASPNNPVFRRLDVMTSTLQNANEVMNIEQLQYQIEKIQDYIPFLYTYRSLSQAINRSDSLKMTSPEIQKEMNDLYFNIYKPKLDKVLEFNDDMENSASTLSSIITKLDYTPSPVFYEKLIDFFEIIFNLDQMKQLKTGLTTDLSFFRRICKEFLDNDQMLLNRTSIAQIFLGSRFSVIEKINASEMMKDPGNTRKILELFLGYCNQFYQTSLLPKQKQSAVISMVLTLYLLGDSIDYKSKYLEPTLKVLSQNPIVPLYAEMNFKPFEILSKFKFLRENVPKGIKVSINNEQIHEFKSQYSIKDNIGKHRKAYKDTLRIINEFNAKPDGYELSMVYEVIKNCADLANAINSQSAFKFAIPKSGGKSKYFYDSQVKDNYSETDLEALIEVIGFLKTLVGQAIMLEPKVMDFTTFQIAKTVQDFLCKTLDEIKQAAEKKKDKDIIQAIETIQNNFAQYLGKKGLTRVPPSAHQLDILRTQISFLIKPGSVFYDKKDKPRIKNSLIDSCKKFLEKTINFYHALDFAGVIRRSTNLGSLWFRETSLDTDKQIQFPVKSSLPFILADYILNSKGKPSLHDSVFFPFEIYNDAAALAINTFHSQFLYKEVEAEAALCIENISFNFADSLFYCSREAAAAAELPPEKKLIEQIVPTPNRYNIVIQQPKLQVLGSPINFNLITSQKVNDNIQKELGMLVNSLTDLRQLPMINDMVRILRITHRNLANSGLFLDDFDQLWCIARGAAQPLSPNSTLSATIISKLDVGHLRFNSATRRFIPSEDSKPIEITSATTQKWNRVYARLHKYDVNFFGSEHLASLVNLLNDGELASVIAYILGSIEQTLQDSIDIYIEIASSIRLLPPKSKDEYSGYKSFIVDAYSETFHPRIGQFLNNMRKVGNLIALTFLLETELSPINENVSLMASVVQILFETIQVNKNLFVTQEFECDNVITHRTFPALWSVFEYLLCSPRNVKLSEIRSEEKLIPKVFGDGPVIAAHILIVLSGEKGIYEYDSLIGHALNLRRLQKSLKEDDKFLDMANIVQQAKLFSEIIIHPYLSSLPPI